MTLLEVVILPTGPPHPASCLLGFFSLPVDDTGADLCLSKVTTIVDHRKQIGLLDLSDDEENNTFHSASRAARTADLAGPSPPSSTALATRSGIEFVSLCPFPHYNHPPPELRLPF